MQLGSGVAVAVALASSCSSNSTPSLGTSIATGAALKGTKKKKYLSFLGSSLRYEGSQVTLNLHYINVCAFLQLSFDS